MVSTPDPLQAVWLGRRAFAPLSERQLVWREAMLRGEADEVVWLVEHPPTITKGRRADGGDLLWTADQLARRGVSVVEAPRGGELTLHAPGQLVAYPLVRIGRQVREYVVQLADTAIEVFADLGVPDLRYDSAHPGVWRGHAKFASLGIHVSRGIAVHGIALNIAVDPSLFGALVSCGTPHAKMRSASQELDVTPPLADVARAFAVAFARRRGRPLAWSEELPNRS
ncbi:MAG: lipoyl(octanoyl) transferase LipB [Myxococcales bacterium FL481]|nr:MAG: lipoyl(octanoyl) transferase LipB [Myxococcales bacterium FL481]